MSDEWKLIILEKIAILSTIDLFDEFVVISGGDDWDGEFTTMGQWEYHEYVKEIRRRIEKADI